MQVEELKVEIKKLKETNQVLQLENDFLNRANCQLKNELSGKATVNQQLPALDIRASLNTCGEYGEENERLSVATAQMGGRKTRRQARN